MKRLNWYFEDGATYSYIDTCDAEERPYNVDEDAEVIDEYAEDHEILPVLIDKHGDITVLFVSPA